MIVEEREAKENKVSLRSKAKGNSGEMGIDEFLKLVTQEIDKKK